MGKLFLTGPKATLAARHLLSRDVTGGGRHRPCTYTLMLNHKGGIESDLIVAELKNKNGGKSIALVNTFNLFPTIHNFVAC